MDGAHRLWSRPGAWPAQWLWLALAMPWLLYEAVAPTWGWLGVCLLLLQQGFRYFDLEERRRRLDLDLTWPAVGLAGIVISAYFSSPDRTWSVAQVLGLLWNIAVYITIVSSLRALPPGGDPMRRLWVAMALFAGWGIVLAIVAFLQADLRREEVAFVAGFRAIRPTLPQWLQALLVPIIRPTTHQNTVAGVLALFLPFYVALLLYQPWRQVPDAQPGRYRAGAGPARPGRWRVLAWVGLAIVGTVFIVTQSRGGFIAVAFSLLLLVAWRWRRRLWAARVPTVGLAVFGLLVAYFWALPLIDATRQDPASTTLAVRARGWMRAIELIVAYPWSGVGPNLAFWYLRPIDPWLQHAHNLFLQIALDFGLPALVLFLTLLTIVASRLYRGLRYLAATPHEVIAVGIAAGLAAHLAWSMADTIAQGLTPTVSLWVLLGLAVSVPSARPVIHASEAEPDPILAGSVEHGVAMRAERRPSTAARRRRARVRVARE